MKITDVRIRQVEKEESKLKAIASVTIEDCFVVHDIKIIQGESSMFIAMPSRKTKEGEYKDIAHPINSDTRNEMSEVILKAYQELLAQPK